MKKSELLKLLKKADCYLQRNGANHDLWYSPKTQSTFPVPRHAKEIATGTVNAILKQAGINQ